MMEIEENTDINMREEEIKEIELNQLALLSHKKYEQKKELSEDEQVLFDYQSKKYPSKAFFFFNYYSGFFNEQVKESERE